METNKDISGYSLSREWFDFCFENPDKIKPNHTALYFFIIELCNRLGWKEKFGLPTSMAKEAVGIKSYNTYINTLNDLVEFGFIVMVEKSKNQYTANIVALSKFDKAQYKALDEAIVKNEVCSIKKQQSTGESTIQSTGESTSSINKPLNQEPLTSEITHTKILNPDFIKFNNWIKENAPYCSNPKNMDQITEDQFEKLKQKHSANLIAETVLQIENRKDLRKRYSSLYRTVNNWIKKEDCRYNKKSNIPEPNYQKLD